MKGYNSFQNKEIPKALSYYNDAFKLNPESLHGALVKSIVGVLYMHTCNYSEAIHAFTDGLALCERLARQERSEKSDRYGNYEVQHDLIQALAIEIKLNANLSLCLLVIGEYREAK